VAVARDLREMEAMLTWLGFGMVISVMALIMTRRFSPLVALSRPPRRRTIQSILTSIPTTFAVGTSI
jgi:Mg2+/citrate symporter